jgi:hypothetical protein
MALCLRAAVLGGPHNRSHVIAAVGGRREHVGSIVSVCLSHADQRTLDVRQRTTNAKSHAPSQRIESGN